LKGFDIIRIAIAEFLSKDDDILKGEAEPDAQRNHEPE
jgi:hypothetical protein